MIGFASAIGEVFAGDSAAATACWTFTCCTFIGCMPSPTAGFCSAAIAVSELMGVLLGPNFGKRSTARSITCSASTGAFSTGAFLGTSTSGCGIVACFSGVVAIGTIGASEVLDCATPAIFCSFGVKPSITIGVLLSFAGASFEDVALSGVFSIEGKRSGTTNGVISAIEPSSSNSFSRLYSSVLSSGALPASLRGHCAAKKQLAHAINPMQSRVSSPLRFSPFSFARSGFDVLSAATISPVSAGCSIFSTDVTTTSLMIQKTSPLIYFDHPRRWRSIFAIRRAQNPPRHTPKNVRRWVLRRQCLQRQISPLSSQAIHRHFAAC